MIPSRKKMFSQTAIYTAGGVFPQILNFILLPVYARLMPSSDFGILGYVSAIISFLTVTNSLSLNSYYLRSYYDATDRKAFNGTFFLFLIASNAILVFIEWTVLNFYFQRYHVQVPFYPSMILGLLETFFTAFSIIPLRYYRLEFRAFRFVSCSTSQVVIAQAISLYLVCFLHLGATGKLMGTAIASVMMAIFYTTDAFSYCSFSIDRTIIKSGLRFSIPLLFGAYATMLLSISDRFILERYVPLAKLGIYSVSCSIAMAAYSIITAFSFVVEPMVYKISRTVTFMYEYCRIKDYFFIVVFALVGTIILYAHEGVDLLLPSRFAEATKLIQIMAFSSVFLAASSYFGLLLMLYNKTKTISIITLVSAVVSIGMNLVVIPHYGILAAAVAMVASKLIFAFLSYLWAQNGLDGRISVWRDVFALVGLVIVAAVASLLESNGLVVRIVLKIFTLLAFISLLTWAFRIDLSFIKRRFVNQFKPAEVS